MRYSNTGALASVEFALVVDAKICVSYAVEVCDGESGVIFNSNAVC